MVGWEGSGLHRAEGRSKLNTIPAWVTARKVTHTHAVKESVQADIFKYSVIMNHMCLSAGGLRGSTDTCVCLWLQGNCHC